MKFIREDTELRDGRTMTFKIFKASDAASAKAFLQGETVDRKFLYLVVETPEGNYGRDINGVYKE